jgi:hypothetical protein
MKPPLLQRAYWRGWAAVRRRECRPRHRETRVLELGIDRHLIVRYPDLLHRWLMNSEIKLRNLPVFERGTRTTPRRDPLIARQSQRIGRAGA